MTDFPKINHRFLLLFPRHSRDLVEDCMERADDLIGHYLRGALTVAFLEGIIVAILFSIVGIKYALLLGLLACLFDLVPYFGLFAIMALSAVIALFSNPPVLTKFSIAIVSIAVLHMTEVTFLSPKIIGSKVGLHPLLIILSLLIFMYFLGFVGLLIAVPTTALIILFIRDWEARRRGVNSHLKGIFKSGILMSGNLYLVSTPIGNYDDITLRALSVLRSVDVVVCEERSEGLRLLRKYEIEKPIETLNEHNETAASSVMVDVLKEGKSVALISDWEHLYFRIQEEYW